MTTQQKASKPGSRWGFLSQAVASVESGLDRILADEEEASKKPIPKQVKIEETGTPTRASSELTSSDTTNRANGRLQARLAQAMAKKGGSHGNSQAPTPDPASRPETPTLDPSPNPPDPNQGETVKSEEEHEASELDAEEEPEAAKLISAPTTDVTEASSEKQSEDRPRRSGDSMKSPVDSRLAGIRASTDSARDSRETTSRTSLSGAPKDPDAVLLNAQLEHENSISTLQEEINGYLERIDALQRNMQMLTKEAIQNAKDIKNDNGATTHEKELANKDEKIALLIEEGTKLTKGEMQYRNMIKKLRAQVVTSTKDQEAARQRVDRAEKSIASLEARASKADADAKKYSERVATMSKSTADVEAITKERNALSATLADVRAQLSRANKRAEDVESQAQSDRLEAERKRNSELQDDLSSARIEKDLAEDKFRREIEDLRQSLAREKEQARQMETEMLAEQAALESRLESFRVRAEEASTGDQGDSQAKLLRQIETLQSQYAAASQNWQGIESTLLARITALEKERDEAVGREADLRRKLRDATTKAKNASKELEEVQHALHTLQDHQADEQAESQRATRKAEQLETDILKLRKELEDQRLRAEKETARRLDEEKAKWMASMHSHLTRVESPVASIRRGTDIGIGIGIGNSMLDNLMSPLDRPASRRSSTQPFHDASNTPPARINSAASFRANGHSYSANPETPSIMIADDQDEFFANMPMTPASGTRADSAAGRNINDMISASTAGAGPSVQLVERMSANVRRLESEKAASKDEIARLSSQRDQARQEVVNLMREVETKRAADERLTTLEKEHKALSEKHQATLELLGEKTEQVEELRADVMDVKMMYRQLADTMGKT